MRIKQIGPRDFWTFINENLSGYLKPQRDAVNNIWYWEISPQYAKDEILEQIDSKSKPPKAQNKNFTAYFKELKDEIDNVLTVKELPDCIKSCSKEIDKSLIYVTVHGDLLNKYVGESDGKFYYTFDLINNHNADQIVHVYATDKTKLLEDDKPITFEALEDSEVIISGYLRLYAGKYKLQLEPEKIKVLGCNSFRKELDQVKEKYHKYIKSEQQKREFSLDSIKKVVVIAGKDSPSKAEFNANLSSNGLKSRILYEEISISNIDEVVKKLEEIRAEGKGKYQAVCIIRGGDGGKAESLANYSINTEFLNAIINTQKDKIPVIIGIGHESIGKKEYDSDGDAQTPFCAEISAFNAHSPAGAARFFNRQFDLLNRKERPEKEAEKAEKNNTQIQTLNKEIERLKGIITDKNNKISELNSDKKRIIKNYEKIIKNQLECIKHMSRQ